MTDASQDGAQYLRDWHARHPGATSEMLDSLTDELGLNSYELLANALRDGPEPVLDLASGDGYLLELLGPNLACLGVDWSIDELFAAGRRLGSGAQLVRADSASMPIATAALGAVGCHYALMLLQPLEGVLAELARVLRPGGLLATVLPARPPEDAPDPISVFRSAWEEVSASYTVDIPPIQDERALQHEALVELLADAGFTSVSIQSWSATKQMGVTEATRHLLLTYLPDLLPPAGLSELRRVLETGLATLDGGADIVTFVLCSDLVTAYRG